ncbi:MAG: M1 family metallopeptidase [Nitrospira sp.]|nr:M1 family metallopeptidase [Nitrospira sp.]
MPSFTLLGSGSIKRHYTQPYALGHEIVHSWIGNSVFNRDGQGNWVEGLTTYLANYYWHELAQDDRQALEQRRMMLQGYNLYVRPEDDYAVSQFFRKHDEKDNAIGYQKSAFVFHLLRREIGDEPFWRGLKTFVADVVTINRLIGDRSSKSFLEKADRTYAGFLSNGSSRQALLSSLLEMRVLAESRRMETKMSGN